MSLSKILKSLSVLGSLAIKWGFEGGCEFAMKCADASTAAPDKQIVNTFIMQGREGGRGLQGFKLRAICLTVNKKVYFPTNYTFL